MKIIRVDNLEKSTPHLTYGELKEGDGFTMVDSSQHFRIKLENGHLFPETETENGTFRKQGSWDSSEKVFRADFEIKWCIGKNQS